MIVLCNNFFLQFKYIIQIFKENNATINSIEKALYNITVWNSSESLESLGGIKESIFLSGGTGRPAEKMRERMKRNKSTGIEKRGATSDRTPRNKVVDAYWRSREVELRCS